MCTINVTLKMPGAHVKKRCLRARRCFWLRKNRAPAGSQSAGARFLWQNLRRGSVSGLNCRRKERHLLQSPPSPIKTANTNKKSAQPNPLAARIHSLPLREIHVRPRFRRRYGTALSRPDLAQKHHSDRLAGLLTPFSLRRNGARAILLFRWLYSSTGRTVLQILFFVRPAKNPDGKLPLPAAGLGDSLAQTKQLGT